MSDGKQDRASHLIERAAERLRLDGVSSGVIDGSAAGMLGHDQTLRANGPLLGGLDEQAKPPGARPRLPSVALPDVAPPPEDASPNSVASLRVQQPEPLNHETMVRAGMIDWSSARTRLSEEFRVVQAQVLRSAFSADAEPLVMPSPNGAVSVQPRTAGEARQATNIVMVTSARPREGKSFTSINLAASIARQRDRDVLLVDIDSKRNSITDQLGLRGRPGLMELATDPRTDPQDLIVPTEMSHLSVLSFGASADGAELLASRQMARVIRNLGRRFAERLVILDAPPALASSDASAVAPIVGQIVFVVEAEQTQRPEVESALDLVQSCPNITLLLNKVQLRSRHTFGGYYSIYTYNN